jgi:hypothetical protein
VYCGFGLVLLPNPSPKSQKYETAFWLPWLVNCTASGARPELGIAEIAATGSAGRGPVGVVVGIFVAVKVAVGVNVGGGSATIVVCAELTPPGPDTMSVTT